MINFEESPESPHVEETEEQASVWEAALDPSLMDLKSSAPEIFQAILQSMKGLGGATPRVTPNPRFPSPG